jgi:hypothetical protein
MPMIAADRQLDQCRREIVAGFSPIEARVGHQDHEPAECQHQDARRQQPMGHSHPSRVACGFERGPRGRDGGIGGELIQHRFGSNSAREGGVVSTADNRKKAHFRKSLPCRRRRATVRRAFRRARSLSRWC